MTRFVGEPSAMRVVAEQGAKVDSLSKRPAPASPRAIAYIASQNDTSVPTATYTRLGPNADVSGNSDDAIFTVDASAGFIDILVDGDYEATLAGKWTNTGVQTWNAYIYWRAGTSRTSSTISPLQTGRNPVQQVTPSIDLEGFWIHVHDAQAIPIIGGQSGLVAAPCRVLAYVYHEEGVTRTVDNYSLVVRRLGDGP